MMNKVFLDSNILIYLYSKDEIKKQQIANGLISEYKNIFISSQVLFEFTYVVHRKFKIDYANILKGLEEFHNAFNFSIITFNTLQKAIQLASKHKYSFPDSLILASAIENNCSIVFSEDMHSNHTVDELVKIINPFKSYTARAG
jgi:predicted nucleic acid-binding protein